MSRRVSHQNLKNKFIEASPMTSYEALKINLVDQVVPSFKLEGVAVDWLNKVAALPKQALTLIKNNKIKDDEQGAFESLWLGKEHSVALNKFIKK